MKNTTLEEIKKHVVSSLNNEYGYCGCAEGENMAIINSTNNGGKDIKITITEED